MVALMDHRTGVGEEAEGGCSPPFEGEAVGKEFLRTRLS
jgi:hypothetical protein